MSYVFVLVAASIVLLVGTVVLGTAYDNSGSGAVAQDDIFGILEQLMDLSTMLPFVLAIGLFLAVVGVYSRI